MRTPPRLSAGLPSPPRTVEFNLLTSAPKSRGAPHTPNLCSCHRSFFDMMQITVFHHESSAEIEKRHGHFYSNEVVIYILRLLSCTLSCWLGTLSLVILVSCCLCRWGQPKCWNNPLSFIKNNTNASKMKKTLLLNAWNVRFRSGVPKTTTAVFKSLTSVKWSVCSGGWDHCMIS